MTEFALCVLRTDILVEQMFLGSCEFQPKSAAFRELARMSPLSKKTCQTEELIPRRADPSCTGWPFWLATTSCYSGLPAYSDTGYSDTVYLYCQVLRYNTGSAIRPQKGCQSCILQFLMKPVLSHKIASSNFFGWNTILPPPIFRWNQWFHRGKWRLQFHSLETTGFIEEIRECNSWHRFLHHSTGPPNRSRPPFFSLMVPPAKDGSWILICPPESTGQTCPTRYPLISLYLEHVP